MQNKIHIKNIYCHKIETKLLLVTTHLGKWEESQFIHVAAMEGDCNVYFFLDVSAPVERMVYMMLNWIELKQKLVIK